MPTDEEFRCSEWAIYVCDRCGEAADQADFPVCPNCKHDRMTLVNVVSRDQFQKAIGRAETAERKILRARAFLDRNSTRTDGEAREDAHRVLGSATPGGCECHVVW